MRRVLVGLLALSVLLFVSACGGGGEADGKIEVPAASKDLEGKTYKDIVGDFKAAGFTNVKTKAIRDLITGWLTKDGEVEKVTIGGQSTFDADKRFAKDAEVVVSFHTFPKKEKDEPESEKSDTQAKPSPKSDNTVITPQNNKEFAVLLALGDNCDDSVAAFAKKYDGRTVTFDGNIAHMQSHGSYDTRFDFLIAPGNYSEVSQRGPTFQFNDKNYYDLQLEGDNVPDTISAGQNLRITAELYSYNADNCLYQLNPVETRIR
jgi:hypothetical protein